MQIIRFFFALVLLGLIAPVHALTLKPQRVAPGVYAFVGEVGGRAYENEAMNATTGFVVTTAGVVVIDSGSSYRVGKQIHQAIRRVTKQPVKVVINTGGQDYRWLGNSAYSELPNVELLSGGNASRAYLEAEAAAF